MTVVCVLAGEQRNHFAGKREANLPQIGGTFAAKNFNGFDDFKRISDVLSERSIHICHNGGYVSARRLAD